MSRELDGRAAALRAAFDASFAQPEADAPERTIALLLARAGGVACAIRLSAMSAIAADLPVVPAPSPCAGVLGLAWVQGELVPVASLSRLLGRAASGPERWIAVSDAPPRVAFAFERMEGVVRLPEAAFAKALDDRTSLAPEMVQVGDVARAVVSIPLIAAMVARRDPTKEA